MRNDSRYDCRLQHMLYDTKHRPGYLLLFITFVINRE